jgi:hypothetical protein
MDKRCFLNVSNSVNSESGERAPHVDLASLTSLRNLFAISIVSPYVLCLPLSIMLSAMQCQELSLIFLLQQG